MVLGNRGKLILHMAEKYGAVIYGDSIIFKHEHLENFYQAVFASAQNQPDRERKNTPVK